MTRASRPPYPPPSWSVCSSATSFGARGRALACAVSFVGAACSMVSPASAQGRAKPAPAIMAPSTGDASTASPTAPAPTEDQLKAQQHFQRAKELYQAGSYREAVSELEIAHELDPKAKDLVFNLGVVNERLGKYDEAITYFQQYQAMEGISAAERAKAETTIKRLEGAKRVAPASEPVVAPAPVAAPPPEPAHEEPAKHGRVDAATVTAATFTVVGLGVGTLFGIRALTLEPSNFVTGRDGTYSDLRERTDEAHTSAIVADVAFGVSAAAALVTAYLYFGRTKEATRASAARGVRLVGASGAPLPGGGVLSLGGSFQ